MAITTNSFQIGNVDTSTANSVDYVLGGGGGVVNDRHRGGPSSFSNTATDWNHRGYLEIGGEPISETRSSKWAIEFGKLDAKYGRDDSGSIHRIQNGIN